MSRKYKIVIFGATGFTGELCARFMSEKYSDIPIAIAGRSAEKLEKINKDFLDENELKDREERLLDQIDMEKLVTKPDWQKKIKKNKKIKEGFIYILSNLELPRIYKIGFVKDDPEARAKSLKSETGLDTDFAIENIFIFLNI